MAADNVCGFKLLLEFRFSNFHWEFRFPLRELLLEFGQFPGMLRRCGDVFQLQRIVLPVEHHIAELGEIAFSDGLVRIVHAAVFEALADDGRLRPVLTDDEVTSQRLSGE